MAHFSCFLCDQEIAPCDFPQQPFEEGGRFSRQPCKQPILCHGSNNCGPFTYAYHINCWERVLLNADPELRDKYVMWANLPLIIGCAAAVVISVRAELLRIDSLENGWLAVANPLVSYRKDGLPSRSRFHLWIAVGMPRLVVTMPNPLKMPNHVVAMLQT